MKEQITPTILVDGEFALNQAIADIRFYWGLAKHKKATFDVQIWANRGSIVPSQEVRNAAKAS